MGHRRGAEGGRSRNTQNHVPGPECILWREGNGRGGTGESKGKPRGPFIDFSGVWGDDSLAEQLCFGRSGTTRIERSF